MTTYELIQCLAKFPPDTKVVYGFDWSDDIVVLDCTGIADDPTVALSCSVSCEPGSRDRVEA